MLDSLVVTLVSIAILVLAGLAAVLRIALMTPTGRLVILKAYAFAPGSTTGALELGPLTMIAILVLSVLLGGLTYGHLVYRGYRSLTAGYCSTDALREVFQTEVAANWPPAMAAPDAGGDLCLAKPPTSAGRLSPKHLFTLLRRWNLLDPKETSPYSFKSESNPNYQLAQLVASDSFSYRRGQPTIDLVLALATFAGSQMCTSCPEECHLLQRSELAAALSQQPDGGGILSPRPIGIGLLTGVRRDIDEGGTCRDRLTRALHDLGVAGDLGFWRTAVFERPQPEVSPQRLAELAAFWHGGLKSTYDTLTGGEGDPASKKFVQEQAILKFMAAVMTELRGADAIRSKRRWVNALIGWERCAVIVLAYAFILILLARFVRRLPHDAQRQVIVQKLNSLRLKWVRDGHRPDLVERQRLARNLADHLEVGVVPVDLAEDMSSSRKRGTLRRVTSIPLRLLRAAIDEMQFWSPPEPERQNSERLVDARFVETVSSGEHRKLERSRLILDALLPTFPAIGFIGTVSSLLVAMSMADRIVSTEEAAAKGIAASAVTDVLSLCFSTTLMALLCVLVFSPLALAQAAEEDRLIDETENAVQTVLRPEQP